MQLNAIYFFLFPIFEKKNLVGKVECNEKPKDECRFENNECVPFKDSCIKGNLLIFNEGNQIYRILSQTEQRRMQK
jgi:hypothetical protein